MTDLNKPKNAVSPMSSAEKVRKHRATLKKQGKKQVSFSMQGEALERLDDFALFAGISRSKFLESIIVGQVVEIDRYKSWLIEESGYADVVKKAFFKKVQVWICQGLTTADALISETESQYMAIAEAVIAEQISTNKD